MVRLFVLTERWRGVLVEKEGLLRRLLCLPVLVNTVPSARRRRTHHFRAVYLVKGNSVTTVYSRRGQTDILFW